MIWYCKEHSIIVQYRQTLPNIGRHWIVLSNIEFDAVKQIPCITISRWIIVLAVGSKYKWYCYNSFHWMIAISHSLSVSCYLSVSIYHLLYVTYNLSLAIGHMLSVTCYMLLALWRVLPETCYYLKKLVSFRSLLYVS